MPSSISSIHNSRSQCDSQAFQQQAASLREAGYTHMPLVREILADLETPLSTYLKLANQPFSYLFESVQGGEKWGRYSIIGLPCQTVFQLSGNELVELQDGVEQRRVSVTDPLQTIRELQAQYRVASIPGMPEMTGGLVGYFGYDVVSHIEPRLAGVEKPDPLGTPDIVLMLSRDVLVFDNLSASLHLLTLADLDDEHAFTQANNHLDHIIERLSLPLGQPNSSHRASPVSEADYDVHFARADFEAAVQRCRQYIRDGDIMQVVLSQRLSTDYRGEAIDIYRALRTINPSPYMYYLHLDDFQIVGSSPEILVRLQEDVVTVRPIAGTRKRGNDAEHDQALEQDLMSDAKELAEHLMLIDLGRNDVGRIAQTGSVKMTEKMCVERYSHVMHIVSNVEAKVAPQIDAIDVLKATFPAGTVSGAPKIRAMEIIAELEPLKRGIYSGAIGYLGWNGNMDTAIAIRTAVIKDGTLTIQAGAGIVADSVPEYEWNETMNKARAMFKAVDLANAGLQLEA